MRVKYSFSSRRTGRISNIKKQREKFSPLVRRMVGICDIILEVLDARFIDETRNNFLENIILNKGKKIIYIINKIDLVNADEKRKELNEKKLFPYVFVSCLKRIGGRELRERIKIEAKRIETSRERIQVGVIGYPNTGKSSLINFLTGKSSAKIGKEPGFTKSMQKVKLTADILLIDTPGVIPDREYSNSKRESLAKHAIVNARSFNQVKNPDFIVSEIMEKYPKKLENFYGINAEDNPEMLLEELGKKKLFLVKKGLVDIDRTARFILKEWQAGKI